MEWKRGEREEILREADKRELHVCRKGLKRRVGIEVAN